MLCPDASQGSSAASSEHLRLHLLLRSFEFSAAEGRGFVSARFASSAFARMLRLLRSSRNCWVILFLAYAVPQHGRLPLMDRRCIRMRSQRPRAQSGAMRFA